MIAIDVVTRNTTGLAVHAAAPRAESPTESEMQSPTTLGRPLATGPVPAAISGDCSGPPGIADELERSSDPTTSAAQRTRAPHTPKERSAVTYLIVGLDRTTLAPWHQNIQARDVTAATRLAHTRAKTRGINLVVAAVIGPNSSVLPLPPGEPRRPGSRRRHFQPTRPHRARSTARAKGSHETA
jgi:hypothetical protein